MRYKVWFLWNNRGKAAIETVYHCELPEPYGPQHLLSGFWIDDTDTKYDLKHWGEVKFVSNYMAEETQGTMWVPPGRITSVLREIES